MSMWRSVRIRLPNVSDIQVFVLLFSQVISAQIAFYPLIVLGIARGLTKSVRCNEAIAGFLLIGFVTLSILLRGASIELLTKLLQFYFGIVFVIAAFSLDRKLRIGAGQVWIFVGLVFYEVISYSIFDIQPITHQHPDIVNAEPGERASIGLGVVRAYGPAVNSSVSGSILAIMFFLFYTNRSVRQNIDTSSSTYLLGCVFLAFVLCGSVTAYLTFGLLVGLSFPRIMRKWKFEKAVRGYTTESTKTFKRLIVVLGFLLCCYLLSDFLEALIGSRVNFRYLEFIWNFKSEQASRLSSFSDVLFGVDLVGMTPSETGGDFVLFDAVQKVGLLGVFGLLAALYYFCPRENRVFLLAGYLSSLHYGTIFVLCGQVFFGALCANSIALSRPAEIIRR
jgi:hypothetical protein